MTPLKELNQERERLTDRLRKIEHAILEHRLYPFKTGFPCIVTDKASNTDKVIAVGLKIIMRDKPNLDVICTNGGHLISLTINHQNL